MEAAFVLIAAKPGCRPSEHHLALVAADDPPGLGFDAKDHLLWSDDAGSLIIGAWQRESADLSRRYHVGEGRLALTVGTVRWRGERWADEGQWAGQLAVAVRTAPLAPLAEQLDGVFAALTAFPDGRATVVHDPFGYRCLYYGETSDVFVVSSRAPLTAAALTSAGSAPRDAWAIGWLAYTGYIVGDGTGYGGVRVLGAGSRVEVRPGAAPVVETGPAPWAPSERVRALDSDALVELVRADIAESLAAYLSYPAERHVLGLTGGLDSRLVLAVMLRERLARDYEFITIGPPDLGDVVVASALAKRFGLQHHVEFLRSSAAPDYGETIRSFVAATSGLVNIVDLHASPDLGSEVRVTGLGGEILRNFVAVPRAWRGGRLTRAFARFNGFGQLGLLRPEVASEYERALTEDLRDDPPGGSSGLDLLGAFFLRNRVRSARLGPSEELSLELRVMPLASVDAVRAAFALPGTVRQSQYVHFEVMRRCSAPLAQQPFAGKTWPEALTADLPDAAAYPRAVQAPGSEDTSPVPSGEPFLARVTRKRFPEREPVLREILEERDNPAWELIDPTVSLAALDRFGELNGAQRRQLFGAVTAALWLGDGAPSHTPHTALTRRAGTEVDHDRRTTDPGRTPS